MSEVPLSSHAGLLWATRGLHLLLSEAILHRGKSLIRKRLPLGPCSRPIPMLRRRSWGGRGGVTWMSERPLYCNSVQGYLT